MSFETLLLHVEANPASDARLALAVALANQFGAKLIGVGAEQYRASYYGGDGFYYGGGALDYAGGHLIAAEMETVKDNLKRAEEMFRSAAAAVGEGSEWRSTIAFPLAQVAAEARAADLVVTGHSGGRGASDYNVAMPGALILQTGRPVLVAPPDLTLLNAANVMVGWRDTKEARRAVSDALPFLQRAETVQLVEICDGKDAAHAAKRSLDDVAAYLHRHSVNAAVGIHLEKKGIQAADQFLDIAAAEKVGLIVAGAYGHSRLQEWVFGGFTRTLLAQTASAILFSH